jgi:hypothetical protein
MGQKMDGSRESMAKRTALGNFLDALAAVLAGNALYFLLMPHLPRVLRHSLFIEDWGLVVDFIICTIFFVIVKIIRR